MPAAVSQKAKPMNGFTSTEPSKKEIAAFGH